MVPQDEELPHGIPLTVCATPAPDGVAFLRAQLAECEQLLSSDKLTPTARDCAGKLRAQLLAGLQDFERRHSTGCMCGLEQ
jgi:hypothetical protein